MAKRTFGSFHASNVDELLSLPEEQYSGPEFPVELPSLKEPLLFGDDARKAYFYLEDDCTFLNHGAFGCALKVALEVKQKLQIKCERQPLRFLDRELMPLLVRVTRKLASCIDCKPSNLVLVENATTGVNSVISSLTLGKNDTVFYLSSTYGAVQKLLRYESERRGFKLQLETLTLPTSSDGVVNLVQTRLLENTSLAIFDHIPSNLPFIMPLKEIISVCRQRGVSVLVDGAHALGSLSLSLRNLQPDAYVMNAHKWLCAPKGCGALYVNDRWRDIVHPSVKSHGLQSGFASEFLWTGLRDYSGLLSLEAVLQFWDTYGWDNIMQRNHLLVVQAANLLKKQWDTFFPFSLDMCPSMALIALPHALYSEIPNLRYEHAELIQNALYKQYNIEVPIKCVCGTLYVRISAHLHNQLQQYQRLADAMLQLTEKRFLKRNDV